MNIIIMPNDFIIKKMNQAQTDLAISLTDDLKKHLVNILTTSMQNKYILHNFSGIDLLKSFEEKNYTTILEIANNNLLLCGLFPSFASSPTNNQNLTYRIELCKLAFKTAACNTNNTHAQIILYNQLSITIIDLIDILLKTNNTYLQPQNITQLLAYDSKYAKFILQGY